MTTIRAFAPKIRAHFYNFLKRTEETPQGQILQYFYRTLKAFLLRLFKIFVKLAYPTMVAKNFQIDDVKKRENIFAS